MFLPSEAQRFISLINFVKGGENTIVHDIQKK